MKSSKMLLALIAVASISSTAFAVDSTDRTSMPNSCSERDANCVIQNGPPRRRGGEISGTNPSSNASGASTVGSGGSSTDPRASSIPSNSRDASPR